MSRIKKAMDDTKEPYRMLVMPDHPTPICIRTHTANPVPYILYDSTMERKKMARYTEKEAAASGIYEANGYKLMDRLLQK